MNTVSRIYLPVSQADLESLPAVKSLSVQGKQVFTVTPELRDAWPSIVDPEEREFVALQAAAAAAAQSGRHVVAAADVDPELLEPVPGQESTGAVTMTQDVPLSRIPSLHVLDPVAQHADDSDLELSWYDITELDDVVDQIRSRTT